MNTLWHLAEPSGWAKAQAAGFYEGSTRGASLADVGFVHCSYPEQLVDVVSAVYADVIGDFVVLEVNRQRLEEGGLSVRDEPGDPSDPGSALFPHVYGPVPVAAVVRVMPVRVTLGDLNFLGHGSGHFTAGSAS